MATAKKLLQLSEKTNMANLDGTSPEDRLAHLYALQSIAASLIQIVSLTSDRPVCNNPAHAGIGAPKGG